MTSCGVTDDSSNRASPLLLSIRLSLFGRALPRLVDLRVYLSPASAFKVFHPNLTHSERLMSCASPVLINRSRSRSTSRYMCARSKTDRKAVRCYPLAKREGRDCHCGFTRHLNDSLSNARHSRCDYPMCSVCPMQCPYHCGPTTCAILPFRCAFPMLTARDPSAGLFSSSIPVV
jgi:hypothetical protein